MRYGGRCFAAYRVDPALEIHRVLISHPSKFESPSWVELGEAKEAQE